MRTPLNRLPKAIQDALIERILSKNFKCQDDVLWLESLHGVETSKTSVNRYSINIRNKYSALVDLGLPIKDIVLNRGDFEAVGIDRIKQKLIDEAERRVDSLIGSIGTDAPKVESHE